MSAVSFAGVLALLGGAAARQSGYVPSDPPVQGYITSREPHSYLSASDIPQNW